MLGFATNCCCSDCLIARFSVQGSEMENEALLERIGIGDLGIEDPNVDQFDGR